MTKKAAFTPARRPPLAILLLALFLATGCYHGPYRGILGGGIDTIAIPFVGNQTVEYAAADSLMQATVVAFREDGQLRLVDEGGADAILLLDILSVDDRIHQGRVLGQYQFSMVVSVEIKSFEGAVLLRQYESVGRGTYEADNERDQAIGKAARMVAADIVGRAQ